MSSAGVRQSFLVCRETGNYATIQAAIDAVPDGEGGEFVIFIRKGVYREYVHCPPSKGAIALVGEDRALTLVTVGENRLPTKESAALIVDCAQFRAENLSFENAAPFWQLDTSPPAVAAKFLGGQSEINHCSFLGWQDTLWSVAGSQRLKDCYIEGHADWVRGEGTTEFENCEVHSRVDDAAVWPSARGGGGETSPAGFYSLLWKMAEAERWGGGANSSQDVNELPETVAAQGGGGAETTDFEMRVGPSSLDSDPLGGSEELSVDPPGSSLWFPERTSSGFGTSSSAEASLGNASEASLLRWGSAGAGGGIDWDAGEIQPVPAGAVVTVWGGPKRGTSSRDQHFKLRCCYCVSKQWRGAGDTCQLLGIFKSISLVVPFHFQKLSSVSVYIALLAEMEEFFLFNVKSSSQPAKRLRVLYTVLVDCHGQSRLVKGAQRLVVRLQRNT
ncbi:Pectinesterase [Klebsormidium nitens]|uniref:pectinesterase n=1 Tax=Klebsormidium nitens TaxID=105231 RepID=A0A1Y1HQL5_KLENI|nr:Pectinesterase [Klebsormidium nitens]|eukprot:GAQ80373.1 Pectinesterase [Klebsormidium nitens]